MGKIGGTVPEKMNEGMIKARTLSKSNVRAFKYSITKFR
ncbi:hypothetical protein SZ39_4416 [Bacillus mycoides]|nr:hypothetical protein SZ39_4416 [Bacillus mycoides]